MTQSIFFHILDGVIKAWDYSTGEPGKLVRTCHEHGGWITNFLYWYEYAGLVHIDTWLNYLHYDKNS